jgi:hypothetical protein
MRCRFDPGRSPQDTDARWRSWQRVPLIRERSSVRSRLVQPEINSGEGRSPVRSHKPDPGEFNSHPRYQRSCRPVAQDLGPSLRGRGFKSRRERHRIECRHVAQLAKHLPYKQGSCRFDSDRAYQDWAASVTWMHTGLLIRRSGFESLAAHQKRMRGRGATGSAAACRAEG